MKTREYIETDVRNWLENHVGIRFTAYDIWHDINKGSRSGVQGAISRLSQNGHLIDRLDHTHWMYKGRRIDEPSRGLGIYEGLASIGGNLVLIRDENMELFVALPFSTYMKERDNQ